jgi:microcystin-dependent protein
MVLSGQTLPIADYPALFTVIGTTFGGNGINTLSLPDYRSISPNGMSYEMCFSGSAVYP